jgi:peroxiredoxin Q/BCP
MKMMPLVTLSAALMFCLSTTCFAKDQVRVGDAAPVFESTADDGTPWKSSDHVGKKILVVYFYPADLTGGCTRQACKFRDDMASLKDLGVEVIGVSGDTVENHKIFKDAHNLNYTLLADTDGSVAKAFGVPVTLGEKVAKVKVGDKEIELTRFATAKRWTFVIDQNGKIVYKNENVKPEQDSTEVAQLVKGLSK